MKNFVYLFILFTVFLGIGCGQKVESQDLKPYLTITPGMKAEPFYIYDEKCYLEKDINGNPHARVCDGDNYFIYKIPTKGLKSASVKINMGNRYLVQISKDGKNYKEMLREKNLVSSLSNAGTFTVDLNEMLPNDFIYIKFSNSMSAGFGCYFTGLDVLGDSVPTNFKKDMKFSIFLKASPNLSSETFIMDENNSKIDDSNPAVGVGRVCSGKDYFIYKVPTANLITCAMQFEVGNKYKISISKDKKDWKQILYNESGAGLNNLGWYNADATSLLPSDFIYVKFESSNSDPSGAFFKSFSCVGDSNEYYVNSKAKSLNIKYNQDTKTFTSITAPYNCVVVVNNEDNDTIFAKKLVKGAKLNDKVQFKKAGKYVIYVFDKNKTLSKSYLEISKEAVEKLEIIATSPIYYTGETAKFNINIPSKLIKKALNISILKDGKLFNVKYTLKKNILTFKVNEVGKYTATVKVGNETNSAKFEVRFSTSKPDVVGITGSGYITINDKPFAPIILFLCNDMKEASESGFNVIIQGSDVPDKEGRWLEENKRLLDEAQKNNLKVLMHLCNFFRGTNEDYDNLKLIVSTFKNHPALYGWYTGDEPSNGVNPKKLQNAYNIIKDIDTNHPVMILDYTFSLFPEYAKGCDILSSDPYPIPSSKTSIVETFTIETMKAAPKKSISMCLQGQGTPFFERYPTKEEQKEMLDYALKNGAQSIGWWAHGPMKSSGYWDYYKELVTYAKDYILKNFK